MSTLDIIVVVLPAVLIVGAILAPALSRRRPSRNRTGAFPEPTEAVEARAGSQQSRVQLVDAGLEVESRGESVSGAGERDQYLTDWTALQDKFGG